MAIVSGRDIFFPFIKFSVNYFALSADSRFPEKNEVNLRGFIHVSVTG